MRLQLAPLAVLCLLLLPTPAQAQDSNRVGSYFQYYSDDDATTVSTTTVDTETTVGDALKLGGHLLLDAVSSASVDVVSAATGRWTEKRAEAGARAAGTIAALDLDLGSSYRRSMEEDWASHTLQLGAGKEFFQRNLRVEASYALVLNRVGRAADPNFERKLRSHQLDLGLSQLLDRKTRIGATYTLQRLVGYQASPYRFLYASAQDMSVPEVLPERRLRHALQGYALRELATGLTTRASYRFYLDDWGLRSHTASLRVRFDLSNKLHIFAASRFYRQRAARVFRTGSFARFRYRSVDRELAHFWNLGATLGGGLQVGRVALTAKSALIHYDFHRVPRLRTRLATVSTLGAVLPW